MRRKPFCVVIGLAILAGLFIGSGCAAPKGTFRVMGDPEYQKPLSWILVAYINEKPSAPHVGPDFANRCLDRLSELLGPRGVEMDEVRVKETDLDPTAAIEEAEDKLKPDHILWFGPTGSITRDTDAWVPGELPTLVRKKVFTFGFSLEDVKLGRIVWRGDIRYEFLPDPESVAEQFVEQLEAAGLVKPLRE